MTDWLVDDQLAPATAGGLEPLYAAAAEGRLDMPYCSPCSALVELEQRVCDACGSVEIGWETVAPVGTVHSLTWVHRLEPGLIRTSAPYPLVDVELDSGHRVVMTTIEQVALDAALRIGSRLTVEFRDVGGVSVPAARITPTEHPGEGGGT
jgi:uncharacterized OB-fold protein